MFSDFATTPDNVQHSSDQAVANSSYVSFGLSFSAVRTGLPFDFALQPGLVHVATQGSRRLGEELAHTGILQVFLLDLRRFVATPSLETAAR